MKEFICMKKRILPAGLLLLAFFVLISCVLFSCNDINPPDTTATDVTEPVTTPDSENPPENDTVISSDGKLLFDYKTMSISPFEAKEGRTAVYTRSGSAPALKTIRIDYENGTTQEETVSGDRFEFALKSSGNAIISFTAEIGGKTLCLVSSGQYFTEICSGTEYTDCTVELLCDIVIDGDINITHPFYWSSAGHSFSCAELRFDSKVSGHMTIDNLNESDICCESLLCLTPDWDYTLSNSFSDFSEQIFRRIDANTVNGRKISKTSLCIGCIDDFKRFTEGEFSDYLKSAETVEFNGNMELPALTLKNVRDLTFIGEISLTDGIEIFSTLDSLHIDSSACSVEIKTGLDIFAPDANLDWRGNNSPDFVFAEQYYAVKSFNGLKIDENLGGSGGGQVLSLGIGDYQAEISGRYITVYTPYSSDLSFANAVFTPVLSEGASYGITASATGRHYITVTDSSGGKFCYMISIEHILNDLPIINLTTDSGKSITSKTTFVSGTFSINYNGRYEGDNIEFAAVTMRGRGHSSWEMAKKPYLVKFGEKTSLFGLDKARDWVLQANHADYSLIRNKLASDVAQVLNNMPFTPHSYPVDVFLNGTYLGVYTLTERVEVGNGRVEIEEDSQNTDTDYLLELQGELASTSWGGVNVFTTSLCFYTEIKNPTADVLTKEQFNYIVSYIKKVDAAVMELKDYEKYFDLDSMIDWFILTELSYNTDGAMHRSVFFVKTKGADGKIVFTAPWDFDYGFGNIYFTSKYEEWICLGSNESLDKYPASHEGRKYIRTNWFNYLMQDPAFKARLKVRWNEIKEDVYKAATASIENSQKDVSLSAIQNFEVWKNVLGKRIQYQAAEVYKIKTWDGQVEYLKAFVEHRYNWMDTEINKY